MKSWIQLMGRRGSSLFKSSKARSDLDEELEFHIEMLTRENIESGMPHKLARAKALREFGHVEGVREACKSTWGIRFIEETLIDFRDAVRQCLKNQGHSIAIILTLGICLGSNTTAINLVNKAVTSPYSYQKPETIVKVGKLEPKAGLTSPGNLSLPQYAFLKENASSFLELGLVDDNQEFDLERDGQIQRVSVDKVTPEVWDITRVQLLAGRVFSESEINDTDGRVIVLSEKIARNLSEDPSAVIGQTLQLDNEPYRVIGVAPKSFYLGFAKVDGWIPRVIKPDELGRQFRNDHSWTGIARLSDGISVEQADQRLQTVFQNYAEKYPEDRDYFERTGGTFGCIPINVSISVAVPEFGMAFRSMQVATFIVLIIGCLNVSGMILVKAYSKIPELAIRKSLGATNLRLIRQLTTEVCLYFMMGGLLSLTFLKLGFWVAKILYITDIPWVGEMEIKFDSLIITASFAFVAAILTSILPILSILRRDLNSQMKTSGRTATASASKHRLHSFFVISQVALSLVMIVISGVLANNLYETLQKEIGFAKENRVAFEVPQPDYRFGGGPEGYEKDVLPYQQRLLATLRGLPGVVSASATNRVPMSPFQTSHSNISMRHHEYQPGEPPANCLRIATLPGYFETVGTRILDGRDFSPTDTFDTEKVAIVSQSLVDRYYQDQEPVGSIIQFWGQDLRIIGVAEKVQDKPYFIPWKGHALYLPYTQWHNLHRDYTTYVAHVRGDAQQQIATIEKALTDFDPQLTFKTLPFEESFELATFAHRLPMIISIFFGCLALLLSGLGLYGLISYIVAERTKEFGIHMAFGATPRQILKKVLSGSGKLLSWGLVGGLIIAIPGSILIDPLMIEINASNPALFLVAVLFVILIGTAASYLPAHRATRINVAQTLRQ